MSTTVYIAFVLIACGLVHATPEKRIIGGTIAQHADVPWIVGFHFNYVTNPPIFCGGALVDEYTVITAAHCFKSSKRPRDYTLIIGVGKISNVKSQHKFKVSRIMVHPKYMPNYADKTNDLAVVKLARPVQLNNGIKPIALPSSKNYKSPLGTSCLVAGWGRTEATGTSWSLLQTKVELREMDVCKKGYPGIIWSNPASQICAGGKTTSNVCQGDSGGPMACMSNGKWVLEGAVSFGNKYCGRQPGLRFGSVFTRIASFLDWIKYSRQ